MLPYSLAPYYISMHSFMLEQRYTNKVVITVIIYIMHNVGLLCGCVWNDIGQYCLKMYGFLIELNTPDM